MRLRVPHRFELTMTGRKLGVMTEIKGVRTIRVHWTTMKDMTHDLCTIDVKEKVT